MTAPFRERIGDTDNIRGKRRNLREVDKGLARRGGFSSLLSPEYRGEGSGVRGTNGPRFGAFVAFIAFVARRRILRTLMPACEECEAFSPHPPTPRPGLPGRGEN
jgi:hypothetical protein